MSETKRFSSGLLVLMLVLLFASAIPFPALSQAGGVPPVIQRHDRDGDGRVSRDEFRGPPQAFQSMDRNGDGYLTVDEFRGGKRGQRGGRQSSGQRDQQKKGRQPRQPDENGRQDTVSTSSPRTGPLRFVDTHTHLHPVGLDKTHGGEGGGFQGRLNEGEKLAEAALKLIIRMDQQRLKTALIVVVPSGQSGPETTYILMRDTVRRHPDRLKLLAGGALLGPMLQETDPSAVTDEIKRRFREVAERVLDDGAVGFGEMISYHLCMNPKHTFQYAAPDHPLYLLLADIAAKRNVPIDLHMEAIERSVPTPNHLKRRCDKNPETLEPTIPGLEVLLRHNPNARIVWEHIGWDNTGQMSPSLMRRLLSEHANLFISLRGLDRNQTRDGRSFPNRIFDTAGRTVKPEWRQLIEDFPDRVMLGADEFIGPGDKAKLAASFEKTWSIPDIFPGEVGEMIGGENARRIFKLGN